MNGKIYLVGIGPGQGDFLTPRAQDVLEQVAVIVGHPDTLKHVAGFASGREWKSIEQNPLERSRLAVERAQAGKDVAIVSSGDPGVYAIAATFFAYLKDNNLALDVEVVPGVGLAGYAASRLGAPLGNDSASVTLTDQGTPWTVILKRVESAAAADFVILIYNPLGKLGPERLQEALKMIAVFRSPQTPAGLLSQAATPNEKASITTLGELSVESLPIDTLLIIGNSQTCVHAGRMITPRNYQPGVGY